MVYVNASLVATVDQAFAALPHGGSKLTTRLTLLDGRASRQLFVEGSVVEAINALHLGAIL